MGRWGNDNIYERKDLVREIAIVHREKDRNWNSAQRERKREREK